jgi:hypothetical protein
LKSNVLSHPEFWISHLENLLWIWHRALHCAYSQRNPKKLVRKGRGYWPAQAGRGTAGEGWQQNNKCWSRHQLGPNNRLCGDHVVDPQRYLYSYSYSTTTDFFLFFRGEISQSFGLKFSNNKYSFVIFLSLKKQKSTIGNWIFRENKFLLYFKFIPRFWFFFLWILWYSHIGNHPQEGLISVMSSQNWYMGIFLEFFVWSSMDHFKDNFRNKYLIFKLNYFFFLLILTSFFI